jgi:hypothetical protein
MGLSPGVKAPVSHIRVQVGDTLKNPIPYALQYITGFSLLVSWTGLIYDFNSSWFRFT